MRNTPEEDLQIAIVQWARMASAHAPSLSALIHIPNGGFRTRAEAGRLKMAGVRSGVSDLYLPPSTHYRGLWLELKSGRNKPTDEQERWLKLMALRGENVAVCRSIEGAAVLFSWLTNTPKLLLTINCTWERGPVLATNDMEPRKVFHSSLCQGALEVQCLRQEEVWKWIGEYC